MTAMHEATKEELLALIGQLDAAGQLRLRLALVRQVMSYARLELGEWPNPAERACLDVVAGWLEQPADPASEKAITAQLAHELRLEDGGENPIAMAWDAARATRGPLPQAARLAVDAAGEVAYLNLRVSVVDTARANRAAALQAERAAGSWQLSAARAILAGKEPPPLPALPAPPNDPAEVWAILRRDLDPERAYEYGNLAELRLLMNPEQEDALVRHTGIQIGHCAGALLPPRTEDRGEWACLQPDARGSTAVARLPPDNLFRRVAQAAGRAQAELLHDLAAALLCAKARRQHATMAHALAGGQLLPAAPDRRMPLTGRAAAYWTGDRQRLCERLDATGLLHLKRALVEQGLWYAIQLLPGPAADHGHLATIEAIDQWLRQPDAERPPNQLGPAPSGRGSPAALGWQAIHGLTNAVRAPDAPALLRALDNVVASATEAQSPGPGVYVQSAIAIARARDYQLVAARRIGEGLGSPPWFGPVLVYSGGSLDAALLTMREEQHNLLGWTLIQQACALVRRGLEAQRQSRTRTPGAWQLVAALGTWAASGPSGPQGATLDLPEAVGTAVQLAAVEEQMMTHALIQCLYTARRPAGPPEYAPVVTRAVMEHGEQAAGYAARAIVERWQLDAAYAILRGAAPTGLSILTID